METFTNKKVGILTSGGEAPGYNAVIHWLVLFCSFLGVRVFGFKKSWKGFVENCYEELTTESLRQKAEEKEEGKHSIETIPGTILGSCRGGRIPNEEMPKYAKRFHEEDGFDILIAIGGDGTTRQSKELSAAGLRVSVIPSSIDGMPGTYSIGLDSAIQFNVDMAKRMMYHAAAMDRIMIYQTMGRDMDDIAVGLAKRTGYPLILKMEDLKKYPAQDYLGKVLIISENLDKDKVVKFISDQGVDCRAQPGGYLQRDPDATQYDLEMAQAMATAVMQAYLKGICGVLVCYDEGQMVLRPFSEVHY